MELVERLEHLENEYEAIRRVVHWTHETLDISVTEQANFRKKVNTKFAGLE